MERRSFFGTMVGVVCGYLWPWKKEPSPTSFAYAKTAGSAKSLSFVRVTTKTGHTWQGERGLFVDKWFNGDFDSEITIRFMRVGPRAPEVWKGRWIRIEEERLNMKSPPFPPEPDFFGSFQFLVDEPDLYTDNDDKAV